jgi:2'-5' RNA ligase
MKNHVRAFIAVDLSYVVRAGVDQLIRSLQKKIDGTKWVETQNLHVTLKFLGDVPLNDLHRLIDTLTKAVEPFEAFDLEFLGCGAFPNIHSPRTIWIGCDRGGDQLTRLATVIEDALFDIGYPKEHRRFSPHLTIGRIKKEARSQNIPLIDMLIAQQGRSFGVCEVDRIVLYSSELTRSGPIYDELAVVTLR